jgi:hypothetical protein
VTARDFKKAGNVSKEITNLTTSKAESQKKLEDLKVEVDTVTSGVIEKTQLKASIQVWCMLEEMMGGCCES